MAKILCVLYDDPVNGYPKSYPRDGIPKIDRCPGGQSEPTPKHIDFKPGELLGSVSGELGLRKFLEGLGHTFVVSSDKEGPPSGHAYPCRLRAQLRISANDAYDNKRQTRTSRAFPNWSVRII
jgi:hypothetical protein